MADLSQHDLWPPDGTFVREVTYFVHGRCVATDTVLVAARLGVPVHMRLIGVGLGLDGPTDAVRTDGCGLRLDVIFYAPPRFEELVRIDLWVNENHVVQMPYLPVEGKVEGPLPVGARCRVRAHLSRLRIQLS